MCLERCCWKRRTQSLRPWRRPARAALFPPGMARGRFPRGRGTPPPTEQGLVVFKRWLDVLAFPCLLCLVSGGRDGVEPAAGGRQTACPPSCWVPFSLHAIFPILSGLVERAGWDADVLNVLVPQQMGWAGYSTVAWFPARATMAGLFGTKFAPLAARPFVAHRKRAWSIRASGPVSAPLFLRLRVWPDRHWVPWAPAWLSPTSARPPGSYWARGHMGTGTETSDRHAAGPPASTRERLGGLEAGTAALPARRVGV